MGRLSTKNALDGIVFAVDCFGINCGKNVSGSQRQPRDMAHLAAGPGLMLAIEVEVVGRV